MTYRIDPEFIVSPTYHFCLVRKSTLIIVSKLSGQWRSCVPCNHRGCESLAQLSQPLPRYLWEGCRWVETSFSETKARANLESSCFIRWLTTFTSAIPTLQAAGADTCVLSNDRLVVTALQTRTLHVTRKSASKWCQTSPGAQSASRYIGNGNILWLTIDVYGIPWTLGWLFYIIVFLCAPWNPQDEPDSRRLSFIIQDWKLRAGEVRTFVLGVEVWFLMCLR